MLQTIDWAIMVVYFVFVVGIGVAVKRYVKTSTDFFLAGRSIPASAGTVDKSVCGVTTEDARVQSVCDFGGE